MHAPQLSFLQIVLSIMQYRPPSHSKHLSSHLSFFHFPTMFLALPNPLCLPVCSPPQPLPTLPSTHLSRRFPSPSPSPSHLLLFPTFTILIIIFDTTFMSFHFTMIARPLRKCSCAPPLPPPPAVLLACGTTI